ncbi:DNA-deoxyinosine glycosylase [Rheinheimera sp. WS51]|uniref:DNA-deoxyinosine glycosylase n=1 Tax=Rheinheimera sp. WS51 TaxID=3425886 RepID=UPI003D92D280
MAEIERLQGLAAVSSAQARVLVLGSMPGAISLQQQQYYAHPRNGFWPIMANLAGFPADLAYSERLTALLDAGVAIWDVIGHCQRQGSLDTAIKNEQVNDFASFFSQHPKLQVIAFNGAKAAQSFKRHVLPLQIVPTEIALINLPSTSPAYAALSLQEKLKQWQQLKSFIY